MIRVVSYDLGGAVDVGAVREVLERIEPDVVCINSLAAPRRLRSALRASPLDVACRAGRRGATSMVVVREGVLVRTADQVSLAADGPGRDRHAAYAILGSGGLAFAAVAVQFARKAHDRAANLRDLVAWLSRIRPPVVIGASLNESTSGSVATELAHRYQDAFALAGRGVGDTYPADEPVARRDAVYVDGRLHVERCTVPSEGAVTRAARHRPVVAEFVATAATSRAADSTVA